MLCVDIRKKYRNNGRHSFTLDVAFSVQQGLTVLFGPSGSGKTTTLRSIAGEIVPDAGKITVNDRAYFDSAARVNVPMQQRRVGFVFQDYLLFPHLTAQENIVYGMRSGKDRDKRLRAQELLELFGIRHAVGRYPRDLSGGEQQRVALVRALASDPEIMLLDEPLSAVDVSMRSRLLREIVEIQRQSRIPFIHVTHSPADAVRAGDWVLVLDAGRIAQEGLPLQVFNSPQSIPLARAVGTENILTGRIVWQSAEDGISVLDLKGCQLVVSYNGLADGSQATVGIRAEDIIVCRERLTQTSARNLLQGTVKTMLPDGNKTGLVVNCGVDFKVSVTRQAVDELRIQPGASVYLLIKASACHTLG
jgi:molybdate transport system ATP-binding protein